MIATSGRLSPLFVFVALLLGSASVNSAHAENDPFLALGADDEQELHLGETDEARTFTGPIERLLHMAGKDTERPEQWQNIEEVADSQALERYHSSYEWKMRQELSKPLPKRKPFGNSLEELEQHLEVLKPTQRGARDDYMREHY